MDTLLFWGTVEPAGASDLAAIRFSQAVRVRSIRLFSKDTQPFEQESGTLSETQPDAFQLHVYFNVQPTPRTATEVKQKPSNALVSARVVYTGSATDCAVDMTDEWATRLLILSGDFDKLSLAVYGTTVSDSTHSVGVYEPSPLPTSQLRQLEDALNPASHYDPAVLALSLLKLIPDAPPFSLVVPLSWCLKPEEDDWERPDFPYIYADLEEWGEGELTAGKACLVTKRPASDDISFDARERFVLRVIDSLGPAGDDQAFDVADLLVNIASQHPDFARLFAEHLDMRAIFYASVVEPDTSRRLITAAANPDIARALLVAEIGDGLLHKYGPQLLQRVNGWNVLSDALWNTQADFKAARAFLQSITNDPNQAALGAVLHALIANEELRERLAENPADPDALVNADCERDFTSHDEFVSYLRAWIGVASVMTVFSWADAVDGPVVKNALQHITTIVYLWQACPGYSEIVRQMLAGKQFMFRFECRIVYSNGKKVNDFTTEDLYVERILLELARYPTSYLSSYFRNTILKLPPGCHVIDEEKRTALKGLASLAEDGIAGAIQTLSHAVATPILPHGLLELRIAMAIVAEELNGDDELVALRAIWEENGQGLAIHLVEHLVILAADIQEYFSLSVPPSTPADHIVHLLRAAYEALRLLKLLVPASFLPGRSLRTLMIAVLDLFACSDSTDLRFERTTDGASARHSMRRACIDVARLMVEDRTSNNTSRTSFQILLRQALSPRNHDPCHYVGQIFALIDNLLPMSLQDAMAVDDEEPQRNWLTPMLPLVLNDVAAFFRLLDPNDRGHLLQRLADIDDGVVGIGEWLVLDELKRFKTAALLATKESNVTTAQLLRFESVISLKLLHVLVTAHSPSALRLVEYITTEAEPASALAAALNQLLAGRYFSLLLFEVAQGLAETIAPSSYPSLSFPLSLTLLRALQHVDDRSPPLTLSSILTSALSALRAVATKSIEPARLCTHFRDALLVLVSTPSFTDGQATAVLSLLEWLVKQSHAGLPQIATLHGISQDSAARLYDRLSAALPPKLQKAVDDVQARLVTPSLEDADIPPSAYLPTPEGLRLSLHELDAAFRAQIPVPTTPKRTTPPQAQSMLSLITVSPSTALLRSPAVTGLTKTYNANDFRVLRQTPSARQNTSRMPSKHVDDFEMSSPTMSTNGLPLPPSLPSYGMSGPDIGFPGLGTPFNAGV
ncbi:hypothetical protein PENSPDRAFT_757048 [Peniophora sp. CONT]|nr:hypothetical protein PENSPDRAFT_757048 [Peniophora sp. CONT]